MTTRFQVKVLGVEKVSKISSILSYRYLDSRDRDSIHPNFFSLGRRAHFIHILMVHSFCWYSSKNKDFVSSTYMGKPLLNHGGPAFHYVDFIIFSRDEPDQPAPYADKNGLHLILTGYKFIIGEATWRNKASCLWWSSTLSCHDNTRLNLIILFLILQELEQSITIWTCKYSTIIDINNVITWILLFLACSSTRFRRLISALFCSISFCCKFWQFSEAFWKFWP